MSAKSQLPWSDKQEECLLNQIQEEIDLDEEEKDAEKAKDAELKKRTNEIETFVLANSSSKKSKTSNGKPIQGWGLRREINGEVTGKNLSRSATPDIMEGGPVTFEQTLLQLLSSKSSHSSQSNNTASCAEEEVEKEMNKWVSDYKVSLSTVFGNDDFSLGMPYNEEMFESLQSIGIDTLISMYCTRGRNFSASDFKTEMKEMEFSPLAAHKLYTMMNKWRSLSRAHALEIETTKELFSATSSSKTSQSD